MRARGIALIGLRAAGKTTLGRALATRLGWPPAVDTDDVLAQRVGMNAGRFLAAVGEERFRAVEREVCRDVLLADGADVVSLGGGAVTIPDVADLLRRGDRLRIWVDAADENLVARLRRSAVRRPALTELPIREEVAALRVTRDPLYRELADLRVETDASNVDACVARVLAMM